MRWSDARAQFADRWLVVEALSAHSTGGRREVEDMSVLEAFADSADALRRYLALHRAEPTRELYVVHTSREHLEIAERAWVGVRAAM